MSQHPTAEHPIEAQTPASTTWADGPTADQPYAGSHPVPGDQVSTGATRLHWAPLLPRTVFLGLLAVGVAVGIAGPILLWLNLANKLSFLEEIGLLLVLIGLGLVVISVPLLLGESTRLQPASTSEVVGDRGDGSATARAVTGTRVFAIVGVVVILAGVFLLRPADVAVGSTGTDTSQGGGRGR